MITEDAKVIGESLKRIREQKDISMGELARQVGVSKSSISRYESGFINGMSIINLIKIVNYFGITLDQLINIKEETVTTRTYRVPVYYEVCGYVEIEASSYEDLIIKLNDSDFIAEMDLPESVDYVEDSFEIDFESLDTLILNRYKVDFYDETLQCVATQSYEVETIEELNRQSDMFVINNPELNIAGSNYREH